MADPNDAKVEDDLRDDAADLGDEPEDVDTTDWKAEAKKARGIAARLRTKLTKATEKKIDPLAQKPADKQEPQKKSSFDYAEKAYLKSSGIQPDEFQLVLEAMQSTGKSLDEVLDAKWFQVELKDLRDKKATDDAAPKGTKRPSSPSRDSVDYWIAKGELPPADQVELRRKVVNEKIRLENSKSQFSDQPVVK